MAPTVSADIKQNLIITVYLLFSHNYIAIAYFTGLIISIIMAIYRPSRFTTFCFLGFTILLFSFEYDKHIIASFREQTIKSFITTQPHYKLQRILDLIISDLLPMVFYIVGWTFIFLAIVYAALKMHKKK